MELNDDEVAPEDFVNQVKDELLGDNIYVYTPKGDVFELPKGATPIDFAYKVHTRIGDTMVGALVNDTIVPLSSELHDGDIVKINTNKASTPSKEWLSMVKTSQAKNKIKAFFSKADKNESYNRGKELFQKEIRRRKLPINEVTAKIENIIRELKLPDENELYIGIGTGKFPPVSVVDLAFKTDEISKEELMLDKIIKTKDNIIDVKNDVLVDGIDEIKVTLASCCNPIKGDNIVGYISRGNGIIVHNEECHNIKELEERLISVKWNKNIDKKFKALITITGTKKDNLLLDIIGKTSGSGITITNVNTNNKTEYAIFDLILEVKDLDSLKKYMTDLKQNSDIIKVERIFN